VEPNTLILVYQVPWVALGLHENQMGDTLQEFPIPGFGDITQPLEFWVLYTVTPLLIDIVEIETSSAGQVTDGHLLNL
jgi:hypothetical protein